MKPNEVKILLEKYYDGRESDSEREVLVQYFRECKSVPKELLPDKVLFLSMASMKEERKQPKSKGHVMKVSFKSFAVAASFLACFFVIHTLIEQHTASQTEIYAYIDGKPITSPQLALQLFAKNMEACKPQMDMPRSMNYKKILSTNLKRVTPALKALDTQLNRFITSPKKSKR
ncbi:hypothetical protein K4L44_10530 [Halosquirtibacter laminarini]|uniref:Uncharacterized protein n=1 Tax=Halosquirtibacter laminarini TaxID=3374600 RepID=A0AC61NML9_9BACT|nr:hypothetical protein K4L44_10530 [Prolixibacteraceae bacterium]